MHVFFLYVTQERAKFCCQFFFFALIVHGIFVDDFLGLRALLNANLPVDADIANFSYVQYLNSCCPQLFMSEEELLKTKEKFLMVEEVLQSLRSESESPTKFCK
ncbi:BnaA04g22090D [Brassica napus]|uniref:BnaA04g22090D protein n=1 Tax=Brassica napus TaxID=3708 RepID=A0A078G177_BRANA|nr:BnaA04g22090D [Brassica napus]